MGIATVTITTDALRPVADQEAAATGLTPSSLVFIKHPVVGNTVEQLADKAEAALAEIMAALSPEKGSA